MMGNRALGYDGGVLIPADSLDTEGRARCEEMGWIALDPKNGAWLRKARDEVKPGQPARYFFYIPGLMMRLIWARSDEEAVAAANYGER